MESLAVYKIVTGEFIDSLEVAVVQRMFDGWKPTGGVSQITVLNEPMYAQAMYLPKSKRKDI
jgi:hypothetical protein